MTQLKLILFLLSQRVLALILEEIAIDHVNKDQSRQLLRRAEELHQSALALAVGAFGEMNVQTAKHYGNLGRLYQVKICPWVWGKARKIIKSLEFKRRKLERSTESLGTAW